MIDILQTTGIPQGAGGNIGPLPNMQSAIAYVQNLSRYNIEHKPSYNVYPNPFDHKLNILGLQHQFDIKLALYNSIGQRVLEDNFSVETSITTDHLQPGVYFLKLYNGTETITHKVIKQ